MEKYYTVIEVAEIFSVNKFTVYNWIRCGKLKSIKVGGSVRIQQDDLYNFIDNNEK